MINNSVSIPKCLRAHPAAKSLKICRYARYYFLVWDSLREKSITHNLCIPDELSTYYKQDSGRTDLADRQNLQAKAQEDIYILYTVSSTLES